MYGAGHFRRLLRVVEGLASRGHRVAVFCGREFANDVVAAGAEFADLYEAGSLEDADPASSPRPSRIVTWTACFAEAAIARAAVLRPHAVLADSFALVGRLTAERLGVPWINVCAGHDVRPETILPELENDPRVDIAPACHQAVALLRDRYGLADASPFSYVQPPSPHLNVYCEPQEFLTPAQRAAFEPVVFFGSLPDGATGNRPGRTPSERPSDRLCVYVSFGTVVWRYYHREALAALHAIATAAGRGGDLAVRVGLGGADVPTHELDALRRPNVAVQRWVDQWSVLAGADVFVTHHGLNSTHEAVWHATPMVSYPFFWDQPRLAARCRELGLALPLVDGPPRGPVSPADVEAALEGIAARRASIMAALGRAREWEAAALEQRPAALDRIESLM
jgi:MGT family glycosyltransferase